MKQNIALIGSLPNNGIEFIRIHYLLKLVSLQNVDQTINFNFTFLDELMDILKQYNLKPGFELMGNPSNYFSDFENETQIYLWKDFIKTLVSRYIKRYEMDYVSKWKFENWNEPDISFKKNDFDHIKVTIKGFLNYYDACSQALKEVGNDSLIFGGPGDHWPKVVSNQSLVFSLLNHCANGKNYFTKKYNDTKLSYISLHEKGLKGDTFYIDQLEKNAIQNIDHYFPSLKQVPFVNNEGDPEVTWDKDRWWRGDCTYASTVCQAIVRRILSWNYTNPLSWFSNDNGFLSYHPFHFTQRTLLARLK